MLTILGLDPKFAVAPPEPPIVDLAADVEHAIATVTKYDEHTARIARGHLFYELTKQIHNPAPQNRITRFLNKSFDDAKQFLVENPDIMVSTSDKGSVTIISSKQDYDENVTLSDTNNFAPMQNDPTTLENKIYRKLL